MKVRLKTIVKILILVILTGYFTVNIIQSTFATDTNSPNVILTIHSDGSITQQGDLFGHGLLFPSTVSDAEDGIGAIVGAIRIKNDYLSSIEIDNLAIGLNEKELMIGNGHPKNLVYNSFIHNIRLKIERGTLFLFNKILMDYTRLGDILYDESNNGFALNPEDRFSISKGSSADLKYTLQMLPETGDELQSVTAFMSVYVNVHELIIPDDNDEENIDNGNNGGIGDEFILIEEPVPLGVPHWAHDCIIALLNNHIILGYPHEDMSIEDYFNGRVHPYDYVYQSVQPELNITRAEAAILIGKALGLEEIDSDSIGYMDQLSNWAKGYIYATSNAGIFKGYPSKLFKPNQYINREEMIAVLTRAYNIKLEDQFLVLPFLDKGDISPWALDNVRSGYENGIIVGYPNNTYKPLNNITRAEAFTIICKLMGLHEEHAQ